MLGSGIRIALGPLKFVYKNSKWLQSCNTTHRFAETYVDKALEYRQSLPTKLNGTASQNEIHAKSPVLLHAMAEVTDDKTVLRNEILQALMAAQETTAALISNAFFLLSRHPNEWEKIQEEIQGTKASTLDADVLTSMTNLRYVLNESEFLANLNRCSAHHISA